MGASQSKKNGLNNAIIGSEDLPLPEENDARWVAAGTVSNLYIYPVKSFRGVAVEKAMIEKHGLQNGSLLDRQFLVVDEKNRFVTGRQYSKLVTITADFNGQVLTLNGPGMSQIQTSVIENKHEIVDTDVFGMKCQGIDLGTDIGKWIADFLDKSHLKFKLLYHHYQGKSSSRQLQPLDNVLKPLTKEDDVPLFADGYGFLLVNEESVQELNRHLTEDFQVEHRRFRPNIVVKDTSHGFCEDSWLFLKINGNVFRHASMCARCVFTTVDPLDGSRNPDGEPLKTLKTFRASLDPREQKEYGNSPFFGINLGIDEWGGQVKVGDTLYVIKDGKASSGSLSLLPVLFILPLPILVMYAMKQRIFG